MYAASRAALCAYCSAHSCSFALRRGAPSASVAGALAGDAEPRACAAIAVAVRDNFDPATSVIGLPLKARLGRVYAEAVDDTMLADAAENLAQHLAPHTDDARAQAALQLAHAASFSPALIDDHVVEACRKSGLGAAAIVEIVVWLAVLQMLHRLSCSIAPEARVRRRLERRPRASSCSAPSRAFLRLALVSTAGRR